MQEAIDILRHSETVLVKKIKAMKDGKPKYAASAKLNELRDAISVLKDYEKQMQKVPAGWHNEWPMMPAPDADFEY
jgi:hypothetical protein